MTQRRLQPSISGSKQRSPVSSVIKLSLPFASGCYPFLTHERTDGPVAAGEQVRGGGVDVVCVSPNQAPGKKDPLGCTSSISSPLPCRVLAARLSQYLHQRGLCCGDGSSELAASPHTAHPPPTLRVGACGCVRVRDRNARRPNVLVLSGLACQQYGLRDDEKHFWPHA